MKPYYQDSWVTLYLGDCRDVLPQVIDKVDLVLTDPPYNQPYENGEIDISDCWQLLRTKSNLFAIMAYGKYLMEWQYYFRDLKLLGYIVWYKPNEPVVSLGLTRVHQDIAVWGQSLLQVRADKVREPYRFDPHLIKYFGGRLDNSRSELRQRIGVAEMHPEGRRCTDLWEVSVPYHGFNNNLRLHPNQKPDKLIGRLVLLLSDTGNTVLDPFLGSGTTAYCCKLLNRKCIGIEIEEKYLEIASRRLQQEAFDFSDLPSGPPTG